MRLLIAGLTLVLAAAIAFALFGGQVPPSSIQAPSGEPLVAGAPPQRRSANREREDIPPPNPTEPVRREPAPAPGELPPIAQTPFGADEGPLMAGGRVPDGLDDSPDGGPRFAVDREGIRAAMGDKTPEIRECYEAWLQQNPSLGGTLKVHFRINQPPGKNLAMIDDVDIGDGGLGNVALEGCVLNAIKTIRFEPPPRGGVMEVNYPFHFSSHDEADAGS